MTVKVTHRREIMPLRHITPAHPFGNFLSFKARMCRLERFIGRNHFPIFILKVYDIPSTSLGFAEKYILTRLGGSLFNAQDLLVLQDLESFSHNMGLSTEWALPSEPSIVQIVAGESNLNPVFTGSTGNMSQERPSSHSDQDQSLSRLPIERESVGKSP